MRKRAEIQKIKKYLSNLSKIVSEADRYPNIKLNDTKKDIGSFINLKKKEIIKKKPPKITPPKKKVVIEEKPKKIGVYKEPFNLKVFIRKNIFKFVFVALMIAWILELLFYLRKLSSPQERLKAIVGETIEERKPIERKKEIVEEEKLVYYTKEKIDIEGKRDPFSTGRLTMEIMKKPIPTNIIYARKPEIISIIKPQKFVSILKPEEKITIPETPVVSKVSPPETPTSTKISPIEKPSIPKTETITSSTKLSEVEKIPEVKITPFVAPEKECKLVYRGRMIFEGVEYFFIQGERKTYRVTIGDEIEGYRILKKED
ncbi:MAG: hypothetical protein NZ942_04075, partial [Candidatus Aenigmarchaeota archaeon]|nr:hypothetical protein [Candidatus Aenigmarchaeota archaeon]